jgi:hypothetical protein
LLALTVLFFRNCFYLSLSTDFKFQALKRIIFSLALLLPLASMAQPHHEVGLSAGIANYHGDLQDKWFPNTGSKPMGGVVYKYFFNPHLGIRLGASYTSLTAADSLSDVAVKQQRNLRFATNLFEGQFGFELNLLPIEADRVHFTPYVFGGIAVFHFNPFTDGRNGERVYLRSLGTEGQGIENYPDRKEYKLTNVSFPFGGGLKAFIGKTVFIAAEVGFRYTNTDYLDDVSKTYINLDTLKAWKGQQAVDLAFRTNETKGWDGNYPDWKYQRGDSKANDWYYFTNITVTIYLRAFGNMKDYWQARCPAFKNF